MNYFGAAMLRDFLAGFGGKLSLYDVGGIKTGSSGRSFGVMAGVIFGIGL